MAKKASLGRGLDAVFLENETSSQGPVTLLRTAELEPNPQQPRHRFDEDTLDALTESIRRHGIIQPIAVRPLPGGGDRYQIIAGERRWRAARRAGLSEVPVVVLELDDEKTAELSLVENLQREDLNPLEEAQAYAELSSRFALTQEQIAQKVGKSRSAVANTLRLLDLPPQVLPLVEAGGLSAGHARAVLACNEIDRADFAAEIAKLGMTVRAAEDAAKARNAKRRRMERAAAEEKGKTKTQRMEQGYFKTLEERAEHTMGRRVLIHQSGKAKKIELFYEDNEDLEALLKTLCGADFFRE